MKKTAFDPENRLGERIAAMDRTALCALVSELCGRIRAEAGTDGYRGGVYPDNISLDADGVPAIGPARLREQEGQELRFIAPELFWGGKMGPAADVYSLGMLLYYGITGGRLPFDEEGEEQAQTERMNGKAIPVPPEAGRFLGEIIAKATAFKAGDRFQQVGELQAMVDSCLRGGYNVGQSRSQTLFHKDKAELSDIERIMVNIIAQEPGAPEEPQEPESPAGEGSVELGERPEPHETQTDPAEDEEMARIRALFNAPAQEPRFENDAVPELPAEDGEALRPVSLAMGGEGEDVRVYQPTPHSRSERSQTPPVRQPIPILTVEDNPELAPVVPLTSVDFGRADDRRAGDSQTIRRRRHPVALVLLLCALLILSAIVGNAMLQNGGSLLPKRFLPTPPPGDDASGTVTIPTAPPDQSGGVYGDTPFDYSSLDQPSQDEPAIADQSGQEHRYEVIRSDLSWTEARDACREAGGYLAVISTEEEYIQVVQMVIESGLSRVWLGCHRVDGQLVWENTDGVNYYPWDYYEPSYYDDYDGIAEDYLLLWYHNGRWVYNDSRNDPVADYPELYSGVLGYVIEYGEQPHDYGIN